MTQANPGFENYWPPAAKGRYFGPFFGRAAPPPIPPNAFDDYLSVLAEEIETYDKPVAYLHGDTHLHRIDKPLYSKKINRLFENFTRVETFGNPDTHWVRVTVDPADSTRNRRSRWRRERLRSSMAGAFGGTDHSAPPWRLACRRAAHRPSWRRSAILR
jgi:hypothetical protein